MDDNTHSVLHCTQVKGSEEYYKLVMCTVFQIKVIENSVVHI